MLNMKHMPVSPHPRCPNQGKRRQGCIIKSATRDVTFMLDVSQMQTAVRLPNAFNI